MSTPAVAKLTIAPDAAEWSAVRHLTPEKRRFREHMGLSVDRPVVMTGHQAGFWHPGILAKYLAADGVAKRDGASVAWLVVDQDENDPLEIRCPVVGDGALGVETVRLGDGGGPTGERAPVTGARCPDLAFASEPVRQGMEAICRALRSNEGAESLASQVIGATAELVAPLGLSADVVLATTIAQTDVFKALVERMVDDPGACARAYNEAVSAHAEAGMRLLRVDDRVELPLWVIRDGQRHPAFADDVEHAVPRALLMTGLMRLYGCDLFVHGTGGGGEGGYEAAGEAWLGAWLGEIAPAPVAVASATMLLELPGGPAPSEGEVAEAKARAHKARHDPAIIGDTATAARKQAIVEQIAGAKKVGENPAAHFREMQSLLEAYREAHGPTFDRLDEDAALLERRLGESAIREDRTWGFPMHDRLGELAGAIRAAFGVT